MMGRTHAATGAAAGCGVALLHGVAIGVHDPALVTMATVVGTGAALAPDIDHRSATATHAHGPLSRALGWFIRRASAAVYRLTATAADNSASGEHRHLTHTPVFAFVMGSVAAVASALWWQAAVVIVWMMTSLALHGVATVVPGVQTRRNLTTWITVSALATLLTWCLFSFTAPPGTLLGFTFGAGWLVHILGDALTHAAAPLAWPLKVQGQRWRMLGLPHLLRFRTGSWIEHLITVASWAVPAGTIYALVA